MNPSTEDPMQASFGVKAVYDRETLWDRVYEHLHKFMRFEDDWDGCGASAPTPESVRSAFALLRSLRNREISPPYDTFLLPDGNIVFEWQYSDMDCRIEVEAAGKGLLSLTFPDDSMKFFPLKWSDMGARAPHIPGDGGCEVPSWTAEGSDPTWRPSRSPNYALESYELAA